MSSDMAGKILFIDTNHVTPIYAETSNQGFLEIIEKFTQNDSSWDSLIQKSEKNDLLFDFISSGAPPKGLKTRLYNELGLKRIFAELQKSYDLVIVRGLPETHFVENSALASVSSDILMVVDSKTTSIPQISRSINQLGESPIRGVILVGT
jgi:Mrp family chromosome partitioning ATPase